MDFNEYQVLASRTANVLDQRGALTMTALGLAGEAGETVDIIKKHLFHGHPLDKEKVAKELGDVLWYVSQLAAAIDKPLADIAKQNIEKLKARYPEGFSEQASIERKI